MNLKKSLLAATLCALAHALPASAHGTDYAHHEGLPAETLQQAVANFSEYNTRLEAILASEVTDDAMHDVHVLTYTLENALQKINEDFAQLAETLEALHKASERMDGDAVRSHGRAYLDVAREVVK